MRRAEHPASVPEITIACGFDDAFAPHFATSATSIAASRGAEEIHFIILGGPGLSSKSWTTIRDYVGDLGMSAELVTPPEEAIRSLPDAVVFSPLVWYRTLLPELLADRDKVLSLDGDTLVLQSLAPLFDRELGSNLLAAVANAPGHTDYFHAGFAGLEPLNRYFNAGVMLLNLAAMRESRIGARAIELGHAKGAQFYFAEQDALNHLARDRWELLHPRWNAMSYLWLSPQYADETYSEVERDTARISPAVIHFEGGVMVKPWHFRSIHPMRGLYREYRAHTPWPLHRPEDVTLAGAMLRMMPFTWQYAIGRYKHGIVRRLGRA